MAQDDAGKHEVHVGEVLSDDDAGPRSGARRISAPSWIGRNRHAIERGREVALSLAMFAPPPARLAVFGASVAIEGLFTLEDTRTGRIQTSDAGFRTAGLALDGLGIAAAAGLGPAALARHGAKIAALRAFLAQIETRRVG